VPFQIFHKDHFYPIHEAFCAAFEDYKINMQSSPQDFAKRLQRMGFRYELSGGIFDKNLVAFVLHGAGIFFQKKCLYNGGTGVLPNFRQKKLIPKIYENLLPYFSDFEQIVLEVFTDNLLAIRLYETLHFQKNRLLESFVLEKNLILPKNALKIHIQVTENTHWDDYRQFLDFEPSWQNTQQAIENTWAYETFLEAYWDGKLVGFLVFEHQTGKISQFAVCPTFRKNGVGSQLLRNAQILCASPSLKIFNVDTENQNMLNFLKNRGFRSFITQYEMFKIL